MSIMKRALWRSAALLALLLPMAGAHAAITCSVSSSGFATAYSPTSGTTNVTQSSFTVSCTRGAAGDPTSVAYAVAANNGLNALGINNRAASGASSIRYDLYVDSGCGTQWKGNSALPVGGGTIAFAGTGTVTKTTAYWGCVGAGQTGLAAGNYTDTVVMTLSYGPNPQSTATSTLPVSIATPANCGLTQAPSPSTMVFNYIAFGTAAAASATYGVTCTNYLPYTMALDAAGGTLLGLNYTLALSATASTGSGSQQTFTITGNMAAGQAGTCATGTCTATQTRTLTISY
jgi:spore coat protein U-like protein